MGIHQNGKPETTRELMFKVAGDIEVIRLEISHIKGEITNLKKANIKAGSIAGAIVGGAVVTILKLVKLI